MSLFSGPDEHAANPPETWTVTRSGRRWKLCTSSGGVLGAYNTRGQAEAARTSGFLADLYADETRWYAGESVRGWLPYQDLNAGQGINTSR